MPPGIQIGKWRPKKVHGEVWLVIHPLLVNLACHCTGETKQACLVGKDADNLCSPFQLFIETFKNIGTSNVSSMLWGESKEGKRLIHGGFHEVDKC